MLKMLKISDCSLLESVASLNSLPDGKLLINTINAHSFNVAQTDVLFADALLNGDVLLPDGISMVFAKRLIDGQKICRVSGGDLFDFEMDKLNKLKGTCLFFGSSPQILEQVRSTAAMVYPNIKVETYSPPYKSEFTEQENRGMVDFINSVNPDLLWIGMTAPKQEKWIYTHWNELNIHCHCGSIGAVFDFFAGSVPRAPRWCQRAGLEWLYRLLKEPKRMWRRYLIGNPKFIWYLFREKFSRK
jgi:N-acetylglucosaminyldiphosphoundecaprenol N-acetyl-beta-D-mannosaminyltransferase